MKHSLRKLTALFCAALTVAGLSACGPRYPQFSEYTGARYRAADAAEETSAEKQTKAEESSGRKDAEEPSSGGIELLHLIQTTGSIYTYFPDSYYTKYNASSTCIGLAEDSEQKYPELASVLEDMEEANLAALSDTARWLEAESESFYANRAPGEETLGYLYDSGSVFVQRADSNVLSILIFGESFSGGVHPNSGCLGRTFESGTGKELELNDIVKDPDAFAQIVDTKLREKYAEDYEYFFTDPVQAVKDSFTGEGVMGWTLGYEGLDVFFDPYCLGAYALGELTATVYFDEAPELFRRKYTEAAESYIVPLSGPLTPEVDISGNGTREPVWVEEIYADEYITSDYAVHVGDIECRLNEYGYSQESYLVKANEAYYVYVFISSDNDYRFLRFVDLKHPDSPVEGWLNGSPASISYNWSEIENGSWFTGKQVVLTDPAKFCLEAHVDMLSSMSGRRWYHIDPQGYPETDEETFTIESDRVLKVLQPITVDTVDRNGNVTGSTELVPGTYLFFIRTDNSSYVDMQEADPALVDGEEAEWYSSYYTEEVPTPDWGRPVYRIREKKNGWPHTVNGLEEHEVFAGIMYAG